RIVGRRLTRGTFVEGSVSVSDSDGNSSTELFRVPVSPSPRRSLDNGVLSIVDMPQGSNIDLGLDLQTLPGEGLKRPCEAKFNLSRANPAVDRESQMICLGVESTAHTFGASMVDDDGSIITKVNSTYRPPAGVGIHPGQASADHAAVTGSNTRTA